MKAPKLYFLRHGQTLWNAQLRIQGRLDAPLTDLGQRQAREQRAILERCDLEGLQAISSPQGRAFHTAAIALAGLVPAIRTDERLSEIGVGAWEGRLRAEVMPGLQSDETEEAALPFYENAPGAEGFTRLRERCTGFLTDLDSPAVLVTHGVTSRMLRLVVLGMDTGQIGDLPGGQGVVYLVENGRQTKLSIGA